MVRVYRPCLTMFAFQMAKSVHRANRSDVLAARGEGLDDNHVTLQRNTAFNRQLSPEALPP